MKKNNGFTLVELLVVVVILGIITAISIPLIRNIQDSMTKKKYNTYLSGLKTSAKLYNDSYSEDMFGRKKTGVYCVSYSELENKKLIKDISIEDVSCNRDRTFVRITKLDDKYVYVPFLACGDKNNANSIKIVLPNGSSSSMTDDFCTKGELTTMNVDADRTYVGNSFNKKRKKTKITISSLTGINNNVVIKAKWSLNENDFSDDGFETVGFKIEGNQKQKLLNGEVISSTSDEFVTPKGGDGKYYLIIRVDAFDDLYGNSWKQENGSKYISVGPFAVDNVGPEISNLTATSTTNGYNNLKANIKFNGSDNHTSAENLKMCISYSNYCDNYIKYNGNSTLTFTGEYNGSEKTVYVSLIDSAGNVAKKTVKYRVGITHKITYDNNSGSGCSSKSVTHNKDDNATWGTLCTPTRTGYTFSGWKSGSTVINSNTKITGNISVKADWSVHVCTINFDPNGGTFGNNNNNRVQKINYGSSVGDFWNANGGTYSATKTGYHIDAAKAWANGTKYFDETKGYSATDVCPNLATKNESVTLKANWVINKYTLSYNNNGGTGCSGTITKNYNESWGTLCTPTRTGYTFTGWTGYPAKATANGTATAGWSINRYTLTYNNNGGSGCSSVTKNYNESWGTLCTPSRTGYTFTGWTGYPAKATANGTATAGWRINTYTLTINSNGGSGCSGSITKNYGQAWGLSCTPSRTGYTFGGWTINPSTATGNGSAVAKWNARNGWELSNPGSAVLNQKWVYWQNGSKISSGWKYLPSGGAGSTSYWYYFVGGYAHDGWVSDGGVWYYLTHEDLNRDGTKDCRMLANECRWVRPENGCWCFDGQGHSTGRHDGMCGYY